MPNLIIAEFIDCCFVDDNENSAYIALVQGTLLNIPKISPLLSELIQEVQAKHTKIFLEIGCKPELVTGAEWRDFKKTIFIDQLRFKEHEVIYLVIFELCNSVNAYLENLDSITSIITSPETGALLYELAEYYTVKRCVCILREVLQNAPKDMLNATEKLELEKQIEIFQKNIIDTHNISMKYYYNSFNKNQPNEHIPHAYMYINQLIMNGKYSEILNNVTRNIISDLLNNRFNETKFECYNKIVTTIYQDIQFRITNKDYYLSIIYNNIHLFEIFDIFDNADLTLYKYKLKKDLQDILPSAMFLIEIGNMFVKIIQEKQYEDDFSMFESSIEKILIKILLQIMSDDNLDDQTMTCDSINKYHNALQSIRHSNPPLAEKYSAVLEYDLVSLGKYEKGELQKQQEALKSSHIQELFCSYTYLKSFATQRSEASLFSFSNIFSKKINMVFESNQLTELEVEREILPLKPPLAICWHKLN